MTNQIWPWWLDDVLWVDFVVEFFNEALRSPNHKTCFNFALGSLQICPKPALFWPICPYSSQPHHKCLALEQICRLLRAKLDLQNSLKIPKQNPFIKLHLLMIDNIQLMYINAPQLYYCRKYSFVCPHLFIALFVLPVFLKYFYIDC